MAAPGAGSPHALAFINRRDSSSIPHISAQMAALEQQTNNNSLQ